MPINCIEVFNTIYDSIDSIFKCFLKQNTSIILCIPNLYDIQRIITINNLKYIDYFYNKENFSVELLNKINNNISCIFISNPNNLTGDIIPPNELEKLCITFPDILFIIDETEYEYSKITCSKLVDLYNNIIIIRTLSKAFGLGLLGLTYILAQHELIEEIKKIRLLITINLLSQIAGIFALKDTKYMEKHVYSVRDEKMKTINYIIDNNLNFESLNNYLNNNCLILKHETINNVINHLQNNKMLVRSGDYIPYMKNCIRISITNKEDMNKLRILLGEI